MTGGIVRGASGSRLDKVAAEFDALYSELTILQRRLITARRGELDVREETDLIEQVAVITRAVETAARALSIGRPSLAEVESEALAARILQRPIDDHLLLAALRSQLRVQAYAMLSAALRMSANDMPEGLGNRGLTELLAAPRSVGDRTARELLGHWGIAMDLRVGDLLAEQLAELCDRIEDAGERLPAEVRGTRGQRPAAPADGRSAGDRVLSSWVDGCGLAESGVRGLAAVAASRDGWPSDAAPVALMLADFTNGMVLPEVLGEEWEKLSMIRNDAERIRAMRVQGTAWFRAEEEEQRFLGVVLHTASELQKVELRLRALKGDYSRRAGGQTAMSVARAIARRSGELLALFNEEWIEERLAGLPSSVGQTPLAS